MILSHYPSSDGLSTPLNLSYLCDLHQEAECGGRLFECFSALASRGLPSSAYLLSKCSSDTHRRRSDLLENERLYQTELRPPPAVAAKQMRELSGFSSSGDPLAVTLESPGDPAERLTNPQNCEKQ